MGVWKRRKKAQTIKARMSMVVFFIFSMLGLAVAIVGGRVYREYKELKTAECRAEALRHAGLLEAEINALQDNVRLLALNGELLFNSGAAASAALGRHAVMRNFQVNTAAVGGGIWFEPGAVDPARKLLCYYAYTLAGAVVFDQSFESPEYDYPTQAWHVSIKNELERDGGRLGLDAVWTAPYYDDTGTMALMTTVGSGMYDRRGAFIGMATVDWRLDDIAARAASVKPTPGSFALFADAAHDYILALGDPSLSADPAGASLSTVAWFDAHAPRERVIEHNGEKWLSFMSVLGNGMIMALNVPEKELFADMSRVLRFTTLMMFGATVLIVAVTWLLLRHIVEKPVVALARAATAIGRGDLDARIKLDGNDEFSALAFAFNRMAGDLKAHIEHLAAVTAERERFAAELAIAREIQESMLPSIFPPFPNRGEVDLHAFMIPAKQVGGDFYDFFFIDESRLAVVVADVSDKGVPAALFMVIAKILIRNNAGPGVAAGETLQRANAQLCENNRTMMFVTAVLGILDTASGVFTYSNAGHNPPLLRRAEGQFAFMPMPRGLTMALKENASYKTESVTLKRGDAIFFYTDGVTEAANDAGEFFGETGLVKSLNRHAPALPGDLPGFLAGIKGDIDAFTAGAPQSDDITMLAMVSCHKGAGAGKN